VSLIRITEEFPVLDPLTLTAATSAEGGAEESLEVGGGATYTVGVPETTLDHDPAFTEFLARIATE
jgi:hypothetical protein